MPKNTLKIGKVRPFGVSKKDGSAFAYTKRKIIISIPIPLFKGINFLTIIIKHK